MPDTKTPLRPWLLAASVVLVAANLRMAVASLGPVLLDAMRDTDLSAAGASLLTTLPPLCFGLFGPVAPWLNRRMGPDRGLLAALAVLAAGTVLRGSGGAGALFAGQILAMVAIAVANVLLPILIKRSFAGRTASMTGLYSMAMSSGAALAAGLTVPLRAELGGSWRLALGAWAVPAVAAILLWLPWAMTMGRGAAAAALRRPGLWRDRIAWNLTLFMGLQASLAYIVFGWLAPMLRGRGLDARTAGFVLSVSVIAQSGAALLAPALGTIGRDQRLFNVGLSVACVTGLLGCLYAPLGWVWLWAAVLGVAQGALFAIALTMIILRAPDPHMAGRLSGMVQSVGYLIAAAGPLLVGLLHDWTGGWNAIGALAVLLGAGMIATGLQAGQARHVGSGARPAQASR